MKTTTKPSLASNRKILRNFGDQTWSVLDTLDGYKPATIDVSLMPIIGDGQSQWIINRIVVPPAFRGRGIGHDLLVEVCNYADFNRLHLWLQILPYKDGGLTLRQLRAWYSRHGFSKTEHGFYRRCWRGPTTESTDGDRCPEPGHKYVPYTSWPDTQDF